MIDRRAALATDAYIEALLARREGGRAPHPVDGDPPDAIRAVADLLDETMPRFHPSFRFEERLAARLRLAAGPVVPAAASGRLVLFPAAVADTGVGRDGGERRARGLLVGGAIASGVSIAGAALLAWRRGRGPAVTGATGERAV